MFDPTVRCQHCGDTLRNHKRRACKAPSASGKTFTPWTVELYAQAQADAATAALKSQAMDLRSLYPRLKPWRLAHYTSPATLTTTAHSDTVVEITSYPYLGPDGVTRIMARLIIGDSCSNLELHAADLTPWRHTDSEMRMYSEGFTQGYKVALAEVTKHLQESPSYGDLGSKAHE